MRALYWISGFACVVALACGGDDGSASTGSATESADGGSSTTMADTTAGSTMGQTNGGTASGGGTTADTAETIADTTADTAADTAADTGSSDGMGATTGMALDCLDCAAMNCPEETAACIADAECMCIYDCLGGGDNPGQCHNQCDTPQQDPEVDAFYMCLDGPCNESC